MAFTAFGRALRALRVKHGLSQTQLAHRAATDQSNISLYENGVNTHPSQVMVYRLYAALYEEDLIEADLLRTAAGHAPLVPHWRVLTQLEMIKLIQDLEKEFPGDLDDLLQ